MTRKPMAIAKRPLWFLVVLFVFVALLASSSAHAHGVAEGDKVFLESTSGRHIVPFVYLGAKHMVTRYDHLLFLLGVIFFLYRMRDVTVYVSLFAIGASVDPVLRVRPSCT